LTAEAKGKEKGEMFYIPPGETEDYYGPQDVTSLIIEND
jgi:hypothetical protein